MHDTLEFYTEDELIDRVWDREQLQKIMAKRVFLAANEQRRKEINDLWVTEPQNRKTASYGKNWGYHIGMDNIVKYYVVSHRRQMQKDLDTCAAADTSVPHTVDDVGFGCLSAYPINTPLIFVAGDGKTAQGIWYCVGQETKRLPDGNADAVWRCQKIGVDFIRENSGWKIWHLVEIVDVNCRAGENYSEQPVIMTPDDPSLAEVKLEFGTPDYPLLTHDSRFNWRDEYPWIPKPYFSYSESMGFGPKGHPRYKEVWES